MRESRDVESKLSRGASGWRLPPFAWALVGKIISHRDQYLREVIKVVVPKSTEHAAECCSSSCRRLILAPLRVLLCGAASIKDQVECPSEDCINQVSVEEAGPVGTKCKAHTYTTQGVVLLHRGGLLSASKIQRQAVRKGQ